MIEIVISIMNGPEHREVRTKLVNYNQNRSECKRMNLIIGMIELTVLAVFSVLFAGYALLIYPFEKLNEKMSSEVREKKLKYSAISQ